MSPLNPLNPAAGDVPLPEDPREVDAAVKAGRITLRLFPYVLWRYRERGEKFTSSDSAWLAWLTRFEADHVQEQITWLNSVLSHRGMPSLILEVHLTTLQRCLVRVAPENEGQYQRLAPCAARLRHDRTARIDAENQQRLSCGFQAAVNDRSHAFVCGTARLLVAAVCDEKAGITSAVSSLEPWLADIESLRRIEQLRAILQPAEQQLLDSQAFARDWKTAIAELVAQARSVASVG
jgi:hypothetical protein